MNTHKEKKIIQLNTYVLQIVVDYNLMGIIFSPKSTGHM